MTYSGGEYSVESLFRELKKQIQLENVHVYEEYMGLVDNLIEEKKGYGFFTDEEDLEQFRDDLLLKWKEIGD